ncbi:MAG: class I SAM-dependent methyltransferase [Oscillospiraceae bacterium]|nr:class I SAM-dependent methyltransferase [Oscillospiraceae bacterium]
MQERTNALVLVCLAPERAGEAEALAVRLGLPRAETAPEDAPALVLDAGGLSLRRGTLSIRGDFAQLLPRLREQNLRGELLVRAARRRGVTRAQTAVDATAGLGEDALLLAAAGFRVRLFEQNPVIAALLRDAFSRAADDPALADVVGRMTLTEGDSIPALRALETPPDVVLLDPMFPARKKSGLIGKKLQLLQLLEQPCADEAALLQAAIDASPARIIIKRPAKGPHLAGRKPSYTLAGKAIRYDVLAFR